MLRLAFFSYAPDLRIEAGSPPRLAALALAKAALRRAAIVRDAADVQVTHLLQLIDQLEAERRAGA